MPIRSARRSGSDLYQSGPQDVLGQICDNQVRRTFWVRSVQKAHSNVISSTVKQWLKSSEGICKRILLSVSDAIWSSDIGSHLDLALTMQCMTIIERASPAYFKD